MTLFGGYRRMVLVWAVAGLLITCALAAYLTLTDFSPSPKPLLVLFIAVCPTSLLSIPFIDAEPGTSGFYFIWSIIALLNSALYAFIGAAVARRVRKNNSRHM
jgi:hypothetical protein